VNDKVSQRNSRTSTDKVSPRTSRTSNRTPRIPTNDNAHQGTSRTNHEEAPITHHEEASIVSAPRTSHEEASIGPDKVAIVSDADNNWGEDESDWDSGEDDNENKKRKESTEFLPRRSPRISKKKVLNKRYMLVTALMLMASRANIFENVAALDNCPYYYLACD
jgi:hypothetical protein